MQLDSLYRIGMNSIKYEAAAIYRVSEVTFHVETKFSEGLRQHRFGSLPPSDEPSSSSDDEVDVSERKVSLLFDAYSIAADVSIS